MYIYEHSRVVCKQTLLLFISIDIYVYFYSQRFPSYRSLHGTTAHLAPPAVSHNSCSAMPERASVQDRKNFCLSFSFIPGYHF